MKLTQKITPFLTFKTEAQDAAEFYCTLFDDSKIVRTKRNPDGSVLVVEFQLAGQPFIALNGGPQFEPSKAFSFFVSCEGQEEVDRLWSAILSDGGQEQACGWITDRFGFAWQIDPSVIFDWLNDADPERAARVMNAVMGMIKLDVEKLRAAYEGR